MERLGTIVLAILFLTITTTFASASELSLQETEELFHAARYQQVIFELESRLGTHDYLNFDELATARRLLSKAYFRLGDDEQAKEQINLWQRFDANASFDDTDRAARSARNKAVSWTGTHHRISPHGTGKPSIMPIFLPFGIGQFVSGQKRKGYFFLATETAMLLTLTVATVAANSEPSSLLNDNSAHATYTNIALGAGLTLAALYTASVIDAWLRH